MEIKFINALGMLQTTQLCLSKNSELFGDAPIIVRALAELTKLAESILSTQRQQAASEGLAAEKAAAKTVLIDEAHFIASEAHACAVENGLDAIAARTDLSKSDVAQGTEAKFVDRCKGILQDAKDIVEEVDDCEITAAQLKSLDTAIKAFEAVKPKPRAGKAEGKSGCRCCSARRRRCSRAGWTG